MIWTIIRRKRDKNDWHGYLDDRKEYIDVENWKLAFIKKLGLKRIGLVVD